MVIVELDRVVVELIHGLGALHAPGAKLAAMRHVVYHIGLLVHQYAIDSDIRQEYEMEVLRSYKKMKDEEAICRTHDALLALLRRLHEHLQYKARQ